MTYLSLVRKDDNQDISVVLTFVQCPDLVAKINDKLKQVVESNDRPTVNEGEEVKEEMSRDSVPESDSNRVSSNLTSEYLASSPSQKTYN